MEHERCCEEMRKMDSKELTDEEKDAIKKFAKILAKFVPDELEHQKKCTNSDNNNTPNKVLVRKIAYALFRAFDWENTREGYYYWYYVSRKLIRIAEEGS